MLAVRYVDFEGGQSAGWGPVPPDELDLCAPIIQVMVVLLSYSNTQTCLGEQGRHDCRWKPWEDWEACTRSCDGGERTRRRGIAAEPTGHGLACKASSSLEAAPCNTASCWTMAEVCAWSEWGTFGQCSRSCGSGQQTRNRQKTWHSPDAAKVIPASGVHRQAEGDQALWPDPMHLGGGSRELLVVLIVAMQALQRDFVAAGSLHALRGGVPCVLLLEQIFGARQNSSAARNVNCEFGLWTTWSLAYAQSLSRRCWSKIPHQNRDCARAGMEEVQPCFRKLRQPRVLCNRNMAWQFVFIKDPDQTCCSGTAKNGGAECPEADLEETGECNTQDCVADAWGKIDCTWSTWSSWRSCSTSCGTGEARRTRIIVQEAAHSGQPCSGYFQEFRKCQDRPCELKDCQFSAWEHWSSCSDRCTGHRQRRRNIEQQAIGGGAVCTGSTNELRPCGAIHDTFCLSSGEAVDCAFGPWSAWSDCSRECGGGQHTATRQVLQHAGGAGTPCSGALQRLEACNLIYCPGGGVDTTWKL
ncbi:HMCN1 [Symbiodinium natans]|uniref:HMCN1 protein n=1 Tax=Symbiodinium natans TaxID=878477 RepID=A0A812PQW0_9DINO|nr:HMCN1 [Symbiodinium natans]